MNNLCKWQLIYFAVFLSTAFVTQAYGHGEGGGVNSKDLVHVPLAPNPSVPEFANASGTIAIDLSKGVIQLDDLDGFPINPTKNLPLTITITSTTDPRLKGEDGEFGETSCEENNGTWTCHVHSYVVWLVGFEDGALGHAIPLRYDLPTYRWQRCGPRLQRPRRRYVWSWRQYNHHYSGAEFRSPGLDGARA